MVLICSRERPSDGEEEIWFVGVNHFEELSNRGLCGDKKVM